jgi:hypothetical protein
MTPTMILGGGGVGAVFTVKAFTVLFTVAV